MIDPQKTSPDHETQSRSKSTKRYVLLVEDDRGQAELVRRAFVDQNSDLNLSVARNLDDARTKIADKKPDLVITDVKLPGGSGLELLHELPGKNVPVVVMTGYGDERVAVEAIKAGALDYIAKSHETLADMPRIAARALREWQSIQAMERAQQALREAEQREKTILNSIHTGVITSMEESGCIIGANRAALDMMGCQLTELLGEKLSDILAHESASTQMSQTAPTTLGDDACLITADGRKIPVLRNSATFSLNGMACRVDSVVDITERKRREQETARLEAAVAQTADAVIIADAQRRIQFVNPAFRRITGYDPEEVLGTRLDLDPQASPKTHEPDDRIPEEQRRRLQRQRKDGTCYFAEATVSPVLNDEGRVVNYVSVMRDATRERKLETQLRQAQKMEAVGQLAGGVAHDFNNSLFVIIGAADFLKDHLPEDAPQRADLDSIIHAANHAAGLTRQLLTFSKRHPLTPVIADLNELVTGFQKMLRRLLPENVQIRFNLAAEPCYARVDTGQIEQVIVNLAVNACDAMPDGGLLTLETRPTTVGKDTMERFIEPADVSAGRYVALSVTDTGTGIEPQHLPHIFEPFYTTKAIEKGTGLGLATVYGICKRHKGQIAIDSAPGKGTTFTICVPEEPPAEYAAQPERHRRLSKLQRGSETVLLTEDEDVVRRLGVRILSSLGYKVVEAPNAAEALTKAKAHPSPIDLLISDVVMPGMSGVELAEHIKKICPNVKTLFISGYPADKFDGRKKPHESAPLLMKPFGPPQLAEKVRLLLDGDKRNQEKTCQLQEKSP
jgi:PAS domain S-box-containing protein